MRIILSLSLSLSSQSLQMLLRRLCWQMLVPPQSLQRLLSGVEQVERFVCVCMYMDACFHVCLCIGMYVYVCMCVCM